MLKFFYLKWNESNLKREVEVTWVESRDCTSRMLCLNEAKISCGLSWCDGDIIRTVVTRGEQGPTRGYEIYHLLTCTLGYSRGKIRVIANCRSSMGAAAFTFFLFSKVSKIKTIHWLCEWQKRRGQGCQMSFIRGEAFYLWHLQVR